MSFRNQNKKSAFAYEPLKQVANDSLFKFKNCPIYNFIIVCEILDIFINAHKLLFSTQKMD